MSEPGPIEMKVLRDRHERIESGDLMYNDQLLARHLDAVNKRLVELSEIMTLLNVVTRELAKDNIAMEDRLAATARALTHGKEKR